MPLYNKNNVEEQPLRKIIADSLDVKTQQLPLMLSKFVTSDESEINRILEERFKEIMRRLE